MPDFKAHYPKPGRLSLGSFALKRRYLLFIATLFISFSARAQHLVQGKVHDQVNSLPGVKITEKGTDNTTTTDSNGQFNLTTVHDSTVLIFQYLGYWPRTVLVTSDTTLNIHLSNDFYNTRWLSFGAHYQSINSLYGFQISNAVDEEPLIHFEDFQDRLLFKVFAQSDFTGSYAYGLEAGTTYLNPVGRTTIQYSKLHYEDARLFLSDLNLTSRITYLRNLGLIFRLGYQKLNNQKNPGFGAGLERSIKGSHINTSSRYYFDYFHHQVSVQLRLSKQKLFTFRITYDRIDSHNLLTFGINYVFIRTPASPYK